MAPIGNHCHALMGKEYGYCSDTCRYLEFKVKDRDGGYAGYFCKEHNGACNECYTMADKYNFEFPSKNPDEMAIFLAGMQMIDMLYFEQNYQGRGFI